MSPTSASAGAPPSRGAGLRQFGRFSLVRLLGRSERTMAWQVSDPKHDGDVVLLLPRHGARDEAAADRWLQRLRHAARLDHPNLAPALEIGAHDNWPYVLYELGERSTLTDRVGRTGLAADESATVACGVLQALAYAHDGGAAHRDVQGFAVLVNERGAPQVMGLEVSALDAASASESEQPTLRSLREAAEADVLQLGVLLHHVLTGQPALDEPDTGKVAARLPPLGRDIVRLPFATPRPVPEPLRAIVNRATDRQERQRYRSARTLVRALEGWLQVDDSQTGGPLALLQDKIRIAGVLPASPGGAEKAARLALMVRGRNDELAEVLLDDVALAFELLRVVNTAQVRGSQVSGNGPILTVRRTIAMIGLDGVRRVALGLKTWPGPLSGAHAQDLQRLLDRCRRAGRVATYVRPAGYDAEVVYIVALLQNLGRLVVQYHFADEAAQIHRLMQPAPGQGGEGEDPGMSEHTASMAVLGVDLESIGVAVARWWGLDDSVLHLMRRHGASAGIRLPENDDEQLRISASCANEAVDAIQLPAHKVLGGLQQVVHRYGRVLHLTLKDLQVALQSVPGLDDERPAPAKSDAGHEQRVRA